MPLQPNWYLFAPLLVPALFDLALAVFVIAQNRSKANIVFACFCLSIGLWTFGIAIFGLVGLEQAYFWNKEFILTAGFIPCTFLHFIYLYSKTTMTMRRLLVIYAPIFLIVIALFLWPEEFIKDIVVRPWGKESLLGNWYVYFGAYYVFYTTFGFYKLYEKMNKSVSVDRQRYKFLLWATIPTSAFGGYFNLFLILLGDYRYVWVGPYCSFIIVFVSTYAIVKYRLMDIRVAVTSAGLFLSVYALVLGVPFVLGYRYGQWQYATVIMFVLATIAPFGYLRLKRRAEEGLLWEQRRYQKTLRQASAGMGRIRDLDKLLSLIAFILTRAVKIEHVAIYVLRQETKEYVLGTMRRIKEEDCSVPLGLSADMAIVQALRDEHVTLIYDDVLHRDTPLAARLTREMADLRASLIFPVFIRSQLMTVVVLGAKSKNGVYTEDDVSIFSILANQAALAIENALFYEDMKRTQEQLFKAEKMATIGIMADGLSHQINNRLHAMGFIAGDMMDTLNLKKHLFSSDELKALEEEFKKGFTRLEENVVHGRNIVQGLMKYTRKGEEGFAPCDVEAVLKSAWEMAQFKIKSDRMKLIKDAIDGSGIKVKANFTQLQEVFFNLIDNAYDAMIQRKDDLQEEGYFPTLMVHAEHAEGKVILVFQDNGIGVKDDDREKLFTPFFTTKATSRKGTGLGLYVIRKIIEENHGGKIEMISHYREGTTFRIALPAA